VQWVRRVVGFAIASLEVIVGCVWVDVFGAFARGGLPTRAARCRSMRHGGLKITTTVKERLVA
jgi:hypothetical protein